MQQREVVVQGVSFTLDATAIQTKHPDSTVALLFRNSKKVVTIRQTCRFLCFPIIPSFVYLFVCVFV
jgi:hypothetical protein